MEFKVLRHEQIHGKEKGFPQPTWFAVCIKTKLYTGRYGKYNWRVQSKKLDL